MSKTTSQRLWHAVSIMWFLHDVVHRIVELWCLKITNVFCSKYIMFSPYNPCFDNTS